MMLRPSVRNPPLSSDTNMYKNRNPPMTPADSTIPLYGNSLALLTDLYQLTMAYGYWKLGGADREAVFHLVFRKHPFGGGYSLACGLHAAIDYVRSLRFDAVRPRLPRHPHRQRRQAALRPRLPRPPRRPGLRLRHRRRSRRHRRLPARAAGARPRADPPGADPRDRPADADQLPDADRHQGRPHLLRRPAASRCWSSASAAPRASTAASPPAGPPTSAAAPPPATSWPASSSASPSAAPTPTAGS